MQIIKIILLIFFHYFYIFSSSKNLEIFLDENKEYKPYNINKEYYYFFIYEPGEKIQNYNIFNKLKIKK